MAWILGFHSQETENLKVMKKYILLILVVPVLLTNCDRHPIADFFVSRNIVDVGETVFFTNNSIDADHFEWDFGDGTRAYSFDASHIYTYDGSFTVTLFAYSGNRMVDKATATIEVLFPTSLEVTVLEYYDEYAVVDASVILYQTLDDWYDEYNPLVEGFTNQYGVTIFSNLQPQRYYVDVWEAYHNNYILADEDVGFIETHILVPNDMNYFIAYVDYVEPALKSEAKRDKRLKIIKMEKLDKREYKDKLESIKEKIEERKAAREKEEKL
ncbi:MAG: hypothetical protein AMS23_04820 [Bacteroides sp. SM1_62]|nr:MAG: hypothetical protein AMS23_04820 [Bacteroides sp. SM1_62]